MSVWSLDELLGCQRAVFPYVPNAVLENSFGVVGGVARSIDPMGEVKGFGREQVLAADSKC